MAVSAESPGNGDRERGGGRYLAQEDREDTEGCAENGLDRTSLTFPSEGIRGDHRRNARGKPQ